MNIALIGTGAMARRFLQAVEGQVRGVHLVAAQSRNGERLEQFRKEYPRIECTTDLGELLGRREIQGVYIMKHVEIQPINLDYLRFGQVLRPWAQVHVAAHGNHRCNLIQGLQDILTANIPCMQNAITSCQCLRNGRV